MRVWSTILGISVLTGGIWSAEISRAGEAGEASDVSEAGQERDGKCKDYLGLPPELLQSFFHFSFQCLPDSEVQERGLHHQHRRDGHLLHGVRVPVSRGHPGRQLRILIRKLLPL